MRLLKGVPRARSNDEALSTTLPTESTPTWQSAILAPRNRDVDALNAHAVESFPGEEFVYTSADRVADETQAHMFPPEYLHIINPPGFAPHDLRPPPQSRDSNHLAPRCQPPLGLANGTRLVFMQLSRSVIQAKILTGSHVGNVVSIPRINMNTDADDKTIPVQIRRRQFPVRPAFAMTIDKSQGQTFQNIAIYLPAPVFAHGQLYIALSRVGDPRKITILITHLPLPDQPPGLPMTCNVVNTEIFRRVNPPPPLNTNNHTTTSSSSSSKCLRSKRLHYLGSVSLSQYSLVGVFSCTNCMFFTGKNKTQTRSQNRQDNKHEFIFANTFWQSPTHHFPLLLSLASIPTPSQSYTNRPLWVRA